MKIITFLESVKELIQIFNEVQDTDITYRQKTSLSLSSGVRYMIEINSTRINVEVLVDTGYQRLINTNTWQEVRSTLRNDNYLMISTAYNNVLNHQIYRETDGVLYKAPNTFPQLPYDQCFDEDVLEPLMFQLMTKYTENEVQSMIAVRYLCPYLTVEQRAEIVNPLVSLDLWALSFLSEQDVEELKGYIQEVCDVLRNSEVRVDEGSTG